MSKETKSRLADETGQYFSASNPVPTRPASGRAIMSKATLSLDDSSAVPLTSPPAGALSADIFVGGGDVRVWPTGDNPTSTEGVLFQDGAAFTLESAAEISGFRAIGVAAGVTVTLQILYYQ